MNGECVFIFEGDDTDGQAWYLCTTHEELAPSPYAPCAGYIEVPYDDGHQRRRAAAELLKSVPPGTLPDETDNDDLGVS